MNSGISSWSELHMINSDANLNEQIISVKFQVQINTELSKQILYQATVRNETDPNTTPYYQPITCIFLNFDVCENMTYFS